MILEPLQPDSSGTPSRVHRGLVYRVHGSAFPPEPLRPVRGEAGPWPPAGPCMWTLLFPSASRTGSLLSTSGCLLFRPSLTLVCRVPRVHYFWALV